MTLILDPAVDTAAFAGINDLVGNDATAAEINNSPLFVSAERTIILLIPEAELPAGRTHENRDDIVAALQFLYAYNALSGGGSVATGSTTRQGTGELKRESESALGVTRSREYDVGSSSVAFTRASHGDRAEFFKEQYEAILRRLGVQPPDDTQGFVAFISPC